MQNTANYNAIAFFYDGLCQLVFGKRLKNAQIESLKFIPPNSNILIVGGGTGWILDEIAKIYSSGLRITYIDISSKMIQLSKKRNYAFNTVDFIHESIENFNLSHQKYDVILTPFLLDGFSQSTLHLIFQKLNDSLKDNGCWLYIDFRLSAQSRFRQILLIKLMYIFFRLMCNVEAKKLPSTVVYFLPYKMIYSKNYCEDLITMQVFQKD